MYLKYKQGKMTRSLIKEIHVEQISTPLPKFLLPEIVSVKNDTYCVIGTVLFSLNKIPAKDYSSSN